ncbi:MAG: D-alanyl-D-alanine carboxypeptidase [Clostridia bacterium]|nr:D-alanyl-D-alanine carboxypeptidase [Clostridia bacterium]
MKKTRIFSMLLAIMLCFCSMITAGATTVEPISSNTQEITVSTALGDLPCKSAILMDATTGQVLFEQNPDEALPPASVTKVMTLLLVMEAIDSGKLSLGDMVSVSAHAASMGGSQVYLKEGETMSVEEMLKCVIIASANDCAVALAEHVAGSEEAFVAAMNARAVALGMKNTHFENTNGLDDTATNHVTSARDIAIMSRALVAHEKILEYSGIWMDTIRDGTFGLTNTNRLVRFYRGCTGLKTGSTARAKFCISATAERDGLSLICVIMAADTRDERNSTAAKLLDYGFASYSTYRAKEGSITLPVQGGVKPTCALTFDAFAATVEKGASGNVSATTELPESLTAPVAAGDEIGRVVYMLDGREIGSVPVIATENIDKIGFGTLFWRILQQFLLL